MQYRFKKPDPLLWVAERTGPLFEKILDEKGRIMRIISHDNFSELRKTVGKSGTEIRLENGDTPIIYAARCSSFSCLQFLLNEKARINAKNDYGDTALIVSCEYGNMKVAERLIAAGADIRASNNEGNSALHAAVSNEHIELVDLLVEKEDINRMNNDGDTPLMLAVRSGNLEMVEFIMSKQADTKVRNRAGETAFTLASENGDREIWNVLVRR